MFSVAFCYCVLWKKFLVRTRVGVVQGVVRKPCALGLCTQGCAYLCAQRRMVVRGGCAQRVCAGVVRWSVCVLVRRSVGRLCVGIVRKVARSGCAPIVRSPG